MSSIPNSAIPHAKPAEPQPPARKTTLGYRLLRVATAPAVMALGLSAMALSRVAGGIGRDKPMPDTHPIPLPIG